MNTRFVIFHFGSSQLKTEKLNELPGIELYLISGPDAEHQIDMALLNDLHCPVKVVFVGGLLAKGLALTYGARWLSDNTANVDDELLQFWKSECGAVG